MSAETTTPLIVHIHIFKNAGTSVERVLEGNFGDRWVSFDKPDRGAWVGSEDLVRMRAERPDLAAVSTHQFCPPLPDAEELPVIPLLLLRDPLSRLRSIYQFDRQRGPVTPAAEIAVAHEFPEYVDKMLELKHPAVINAQARQLSGFKRILDETGQRLAADEIRDRALAFVRSLPSVGLVEEFDLIRPIWEQQIRAVHPDFEFFAAHANRISSDTRRLADAREAAIAELGQQRVRMLSTRGRADWWLYLQAAEDTRGLRAAPEPGPGAS